jgi:TPR repeat protein
MRWWRRAAEQGHVGAQYRLATHYFFGTGVTQDRAEAVKWLLKVTEPDSVAFLRRSGIPEKEIADIYSMVGGCYYAGDGISQNHVTAVRWFRVAAELGDAYSQCMLGLYYFDGEGIPQDRAEAIKWLRKAAEQGNEYAIEALREIESGNVLPSAAVQAQEPAIRHLQTEAVAQNTGSTVQDEYRDLADAMALKLHNSFESAEAELKMSEQDKLTLTHKLATALAKLRDSNDPDIKYIASTALSAMIIGTRPNEFKGGFDDVANVLSGNWGDILTKQANFDKVRAARIQAEKSYLAMRNLLPETAKKFAPSHTNSSSLTVGFHECPDADVFFITNNGATLRDCTFEMIITGKNGASITNVYFVEQWTNDTTLWKFCTIAWGLTVHDVTHIDVNVISPQLNTSIKYVYDQHERGKTYQWLFQNVQFTNQKYQPREPYTFTPWNRSFSASIAGYSRLPACQFSVTFVDGDQKVTWHNTDVGWSAGNNWSVTPGNDRFTFEPTQIIAEISFPDSTFVIRETFSVDAQGRLSSQGIERTIQK